MEVAPDTHTHCRLYFIALWVTAEAVMRLFVEETVGRGLDVLTVFMLNFYLQKFLLDVFE